MTERQLIPGETKLSGHSGWVTAIATTPANPKIFLSSSRDKTVLVWRITGGSEYAIAQRALTGHNHFVQDVCISSDGQYALSASWDKTLRFWKISTGKTKKRFIGHANDVLSVSFSANNESIVSGSRDKSMKVWKVTGDISNSFEKAHDDWVSCVKYSPFPEREIIVSGGWDKLVKVWHSNTYQLLSQFKGHNGYINTITVSPDASLCASGGKDGQVILWDLTAPKVLYPLDAQCEIHAVCFSPIKYWLCAATDKGIKIWDLPSRKLLETLEVEEDESFEGHAQKVNPIPLSLAWSADGMTLFAGYTDNYIRIWHLINPRFEQ